MVGMISMLSTSAEVRPTHFPPGQLIINGIYKKTHRLILSALSRACLGNMIDLKTKWHHRKKTLRFLTLVPCSKFVISGGAGNNGRVEADTRQ
jgi:hypothetical protein